MVMNDLMGENKKVSALAIIYEWDIKGDLKLIVGEWKYQRERMDRNNGLPKHETSEMTSPTVGGAGFPSTRSELKCAPFLVPG